MNTIDGIMFKDMIINGAERLRTKADYVDSLNVFPVPDGDTGTNMNLSMSSGAKEVESLTETHIGKVGKHFSKGLLMGARGNSGVILSQLFRGFSKAIEDQDKLSVESFSDALNQGVKTAFKAVMKPVEGTILTVAKDSAKAAEDHKTKVSSLEELMERVIEEAKISLKNTPELLPVLKEVGVVDSGGQGLVYVYEGFLSALKGEKVTVESSEVNTDEFVNDTHEFDEFMSVDEIKYGYCTEFMVRFDHNKRDYDETTFREEMSEFGDSLLVINDDEIVKVHVHTETPGEAFTYGATYGELIKMKVENMREQFREIQKKKEQSNLNANHQSIKTAIITVASGDGVSKLFKSMGATHVLNGGQTMNPSTQDIVDMIEEDKVEDVIILPNNKNIIMASEQAVHMLDIPATVVPTTSILHGLASLIAYSPDATLEENQQAMTQSIEHVQTGQVTFAVRDTKIDGINIKKDEQMAIIDGKISSSHSNRTDALTAILEHILDDESELVTILVGQDGLQEEVEPIVENFENKFEDIEFEIYQGDQPVYSYLVSVE